MITNTNALHCLYDIILEYVWLFVQVIVMIHDSEDYKFVVVEEFGIVRSYDPRTIRGNIQSMVYVSTINILSL